MLKALAIGSTETIIEIGPGYGELTLPLAQKILSGGNKNGLIAIERDQKLFDSLKAEGAPALQLVHGDAIALLPKIVPPSGPYKLVGNLPYYATGRLIRIIGELEHKPELCVFMLQKEVAERIIAGPPKMNRLAASVQFWSHPTILCAAPKQYFSPPPAVDSAVVVLETRSDPFPASPDRYYEAVRRIFSQPRKTILNNLSLKKSAGERVDKTEITRRLEALSIGPRDRPQNLAIPSIAAISEAFF